MPELPEYSYWHIDERQRGHIPEKDRHKYGDVSMIKRSVPKRWFPTEHWGGAEKARELNEALGITPAVARAMFYGSLWGFDHALANPDVFDEDGALNPVKLMNAPKSQMELDWEEYMQNPDDPSV